MTNESLNSNDTSSREIDPKEVDYEFLLQSFDNLIENISGRIEIIKQDKRNARVPAEIEKFGIEQDYCELLLSSFRTYRQYASVIIETLKSNTIQNEDFKLVLVQAISDITAHIEYIQVFINSDYAGNYDIDFTHILDARNRGSGEKCYYINPLFYGGEPGDTVPDHEYYTRGLDLITYSQELPQGIDSSANYHGEVQITLEGKVGDPQRIMFNLHRDNSQRGLSLGSRAISLRIDRSHKGSDEGDLTLDIDIEALKSFYNTSELATILHRARARYSHHWDLPDRFSALSEDKTRKIFSHLIDEATLPLD